MSWQPPCLGATGLHLGSPTPTLGQPLGVGKPGVAQQGGGQELGDSRAGVPLGPHACGIAQPWDIGGEARA